MHAQMAKKQKGKRQSVSAAGSQKHEGHESTFQFVDNRPAAIVHRKLQAMAVDRHQIHKSSLNQTPDLNAGVVQRTIEVVDLTEEQIVNQVLTSPSYDALRAVLAETDLIHLEISANAVELEGEAHGSTKLTEINGQALPGGVITYDTLNRLWNGENFRIRIRVAPDDAGSMMATLMHELTLHVFPIIHHISSFKQNADAADGDNIRERIANDDHLGPAIRGIFDGQDQQHSNIERLRIYLQNAVDQGEQLKENGQIELGSELIISMVNDIMTMTSADLAARGDDRTPHLNAQQKREMYNMADEIGTAEDHYREQHPEIFLASDDEESGSS